LKVSGKKLLLLTIIVLLAVAPCAFCWWMAIGSNQIFRLQLPVYPDAREISHTYGYYGAGAGVQRIYFWSADSVDEILNYYETFTYPFIQSQDDPTQFRTVFNPERDSLPIITAEFGGETLDLGKNRHCYYTLPNQCVVVEVIDFGIDSPILLEQLGTYARTRRTPQPPPADLKGGRLIVYTYFVSDIS
jgi:hypothetical protein